MRSFIFADVLPCSINVCLRSTVDSNKITFICKIEDLHLPVTFYDNFGQEFAFCIVPYPNPVCKPIHNHTKLEQYLTNSETVMTVEGKIDQRVNGNWSCHHGNLYKANVEINILKTEGMS